MRTLPRKDEAAAPAATTKQKTTPYNWLAVLLILITYCVFAFIV